MRIGVPKEIGGRPGAIASNFSLRGGLNVRRGHVHHPAIAASLGFAFKPREAALAA
jgi:alanine dehydrogenase